MRVERPQISRQDAKTAKRNYNQYQTGDEMQGGMIFGEFSDFWKLGTVITNVKFLVLEVLGVLGGS